MSFDTELKLLEVVAGLSRPWSVESGVCFAVKKRLEQPACDCGMVYFLPGNVLVEKVTPFEHWSGKSLPSGTFESSDPFSRCFALCDS